MVVVQCTIGPWGKPVLIVWGAGEIVSDNPQERIFPNIQPFCNYLTH